MRCLGLTALLFALTCTCASAGQPGAADDALLGHWTFDAPAGDVARDASGGGRDAKIAGPVPVEGVLGGALRFDGKDDYVALGDFGEFEAVTVAFWLKAEKFEADDGFHGLVTSDAWEEGVMHLPLREGKIDVYLHLGGSARGRLTSQRLKNGAWYHVAVVADTGSGLLRLFVNGGEQDVADISRLTGKIKLGEQVVGREHDGEKHARYFDGAIDDVRIYGRALDAGEIQALCPDAVPLAGRDPRNIRTGHVIPDEGYCDQPYVVVLDDGAWLCTMTTGPGREGQQGQHVVSTRSTDQGRTWAPLVDVEPSGELEASWIVPLVVPGGRVYGFYTFNGDNVRRLNGKPIRADTIGWYAYKYTDDGGRSWSQRRWRLPMRLTACDRGNDFQGEVQIFWGIDKPTAVDGNAMFAFTKLGRFMLEDGEGWFYRSDNLLTEADADRHRWELLPEGEHGLRADEFGSTQEEHNLVPLADGSLYCVYRTTKGFPCHAYSRDDGRSWTKPVPMTYEPDGPRIVKTPRACPQLWKCENGKYLFWFHNHGGLTFRGRNPVWLAGGIERDGKLHWSEPEILLYNPDPKGRGMSYPDLIEQDGRYWVTETQKTIARVHELDASLLEGLWRQGLEKTISREGLLLEANAAQLAAGKAALSEPLDLQETGGVSLDVWLKLDDPAAEQTILDGRNADGAGISLATTAEGAVRLSISDGQTEAAWDCDPGLLQPGKLHHVAAIVDAGPRIIRFVVDGHVCDGGRARPCGWTHYAGDPGDVSGSKNLQIGPGVQSLRVYGRYLRTSEAVANYHAGP